MKKTRLIQWLALLLAGALLLGFAACNSEGNDDPTTTAPTTTTNPDAYTTEPPTTAAAAVPGFWNLEIRGVPNVTSFNSQDAQYLPKVQVEITSTNLETGLSSKVTYGGITLRSLLSFCGVQYVSSVTVSSVNGASAVYNPVMAMAEDTILAWEVDGAPIDADPPLRMCPKSGPAELLIRQVSSLHVIPGMPETTQPTYTYAAPPAGNTYQPPYTTKRTTWSTYPASVPGIDQFTTAPPPTNPDGTPVTTTEATTTTTTTTTTRTTRTYSSYVYTQPTQRTTTTTTTRPKPDWWPPDVEWEG